MTPSTAAVLKFPKLDFATWRVGQNPVSYVFETDAVDKPLAIAMGTHKKESATSTWVEIALFETPTTKNRWSMKDVIGK